MKLMKRRAVLKNYKKDRKKRELMSKAVEERGKESEVESDTFKLTLTPAALWVKKANQSDRDEIQAIAVPKVMYKVT